MHPLEFLGDLVGRELVEAEHLIAVAVNAGVLVVRGNQVRFTHDRQRLAAQLLVPKSDKVEAGKLHLRIFNFLYGPAFLDDYLFEAVEQALAARDIGVQVASDHVVVALVADAAERASLTSNFTLTKQFVTSAQTMMDQVGGLPWLMKIDRQLCFRHVRLLTDIAIVFHEHEMAFEVLEAMKLLCKTRVEKITISTMLVRQLIAGNQHHVAIERLVETLDEFGYNPEQPTAVDTWDPRSPQEVEDFAASLTYEDPTPEAMDELLIVCLISYAGPSIYITQPDRRYAIFRIGLSIAKKLGLAHEASSYLIVAYAMILDNARIQYTLMKVASQICDRYPVSVFTNNTRVGVAAQAHHFCGLAEVAKPMTEAFDASITLADYEVASCESCVLSDLSSPQTSLHSTWRTASLRLLQLTGPSWRSGTK